MILPFGYDPARAISSPAGLCHVDFDPTVGKARPRLASVAPATVFLRGRGGLDWEALRGGGAVMDKH